MIGALVWKEYRELRPAWLGITSVGSILLTGLARWLNPGPQGLDAPGGGGLVLGGLLLCWCYGIVSGAVLLAGEREDCTLAFLDSLPAWRGRVWTAKVVAGVTLVPVQAAAMLVILLALQAVTAAGAGMVVAALIAAGLVGLGWGVSSSVRTRTVLGAIVRAAAMQILAVAVLGLVLILFWLARGSVPRELSGRALAAFVLGLAALAVAAAAWSAYTFGSPDRERRHPTRGTGQVRGSAAVLWLTVKQTRRFPLVVGALGLAGGLLLLVNPRFGWPLVSLLLGVTCGLWAFAGDCQMRWWLADQRLPTGGFWWARVLAALATACIGSFLALVPALAGHVPAMLGITSNPPARLEINLLAGLFGRALRLGDETVILANGRHGARAAAEAFLLMWMVHGWAAGCLCGLVYRRLWIAATAAGLIGLGGSLIWLPYLAAGGLHLWQTLGLPLGLLLASRRLLPLWATGRIVSGWATAAQAAGLGLAVCWTFVAMSYYAAQWPTQFNAIFDHVWLRLSP
jgi:hypothetical protein